MAETFSGPQKIFFRIRSIVQICLSDSWLCDRRIALPGELVGYFIFFDPTSFPLRYFIAKKKQFHNWPHLAFSRRRRVHFFVLNRHFPRSWTSSSPSWHTPMSLLNVSDHLYFVRPRRPAFHLQFLGNKPQIWCWSENMTLSWKGPWLRKHRSRPSWFSLAHLLAV